MMIEQPGENIQGRKGLQRTSAVNYISALKLHGRLGLFCVCHCWLQTLAFLELQEQDACNSLLVSLVKSQLGGVNSARHGGARFCWRRQLPEVPGRCTSYLLAGYSRPGAAAGRLRPESAESSNTSTVNIQVNTRSIH